MSSEAKKLDDAGFREEILESPGVALVDFGAEWCSPCQQLSPIVDRLSSRYEGTAKVVKVDIEEGGAAAAEFLVSSIPTVLIFRDGQVLDRIVGLVAEDVLAARLDAVIAVEAAA